MAPWLIATLLLLILILPVLLAIRLRRRYTVPWLYFCVGILTFLGAQVVHLPLNELLSSIGLLPEDAVEGIELVQLALIAGLTAGLTEELARAAGYAIVRRARRYEDAIMMGLGHGGIEAMVIGVLIAAGSSALWAFSNSTSLIAELSSEQLVMLEQQMELLEGSQLLVLAALTERVIALAIQVGLSVLVLQTFVRRNWLFVAMAVLYHAAFDFVAVYGASQIENIWLLEGMLALMAAPLIIWVWRIRPENQMKKTRQFESLIPEIHLFVVSLRKEMLFQWRTRRVVIIGAIFLLFGMVSPLLAKFTPALLGSLEGAEQLADIIPEPTAEEAISQYIKNLTQFGFVLAILMGMGSIVGEKEKGTAAMILSKPMPRWVFITSKFVSQTLVYSLGFILAMIAAYYYTVFLFGPIDFFAFLVVNILLLLWLLVFVAVTIFGSTVGRTTGAAAGVALIGSVLILLAGSIPRYGALAPSGLVIWAGQLLIGNETIPNGGSVALSLVLIMVALIAALAVFEEQEV